MAGQGTKWQSGRGKRLPAEVLSSREVGQLLAACGDDHGGLRARALIAVLYRAGLRIGEALALTPKDLDLDGHALRVLRGKGDASRTVGIDPGAAGHVRAWLAARAKLNPPVGAPVFCTARGGAMSASYARRLLPALARRAGIEKRVHAHGLRHTHAAELRGEGVDIGIISRQLGHKSLLTTIIYLDHIAPTAVIEAMRKRTWRGGEGD